jgi:hypothetical protein
MGQPSKSRFGLLHSRQSRGAEINRAIIRAINAGAP